MEYEGVCNQPKQATLRAQVAARCEATATRTLAAQSANRLPPAGDLFFLMLLWLYAR